MSATYIYTFKIVEICKIVAIFVVLRAIRVYFIPYTFSIILVVSLSNLKLYRLTDIFQVGNSKSLPDFLADSAVCTQKGETLSVPNSPEGEVERFRHELEVTKRQLINKTRLCDCLNRQLEIARNKEHEYTQNLTKALEQVENNLEKSNVSVHFH